MFRGTRPRAKPLKTDVYTFAEPERKPSAAAVKVAAPSTPAFTSASAWDFPKGIVACWETLAMPGSEEKRLTATSDLAGDGFPFASASWTITTPEPPGGRCEGMAVSMMETGGSRPRGLWAPTTGAPRDGRDEMNMRSARMAANRRPRFTSDEP